MSDEDLYARSEIESAIVSGDTETYFESIRDADFEHGVGDGTTLLHEAAFMGRERIAEDLVARGIDLDAQDHSGKTALHLAIEEEHDEIAHLLLDNGARVDLTDDFGAEPLQRAVLDANYELTERLLEHGADPTHENESGISPWSLVTDGWPAEFVTLLESYRDDESES